MVDLNPMISISILSSFLREWKNFLQKMKRNAINDALRLLKKHHLKITWKSPENHLKITWKSLNEVLAVHLKLSMRTIRLITNRFGSSWNPSKYCKLRKLELEFFLLNFFIYLFENMIHKWFQQGALCSADWWLKLMI